MLTPIPGRRRHRDQFSDRRRYQQNRRVLGGQRQRECHDEFEKRGCRVYCPSNIRTWMNQAKERDSRNKNAAKSARMKERPDRYRAEAYLAGRMVRPSAFVKIWAETSKLTIL
jgi:hypothetical protein